MAKSTVHRLEPRIYYYTFGPNEPALTVKSGDAVVARTRDAGGFNEKMEPMPEEMKQRLADTALCERNPQVGPVYVEGAEPGDILAVTIQRIKLNRDYAWSVNMLSGKMIHSPKSGMYYLWPVRNER